MHSEFGCLLVAWQEKIQMFSRLPQKRNYKDFLASPKKVQITIRLPRARYGQPFTPIRDVIIDNFPFESTLEDLKWLLSEKEPNLIPGEFYFRWGIDTNSFFSFTNNNDQESLRHVLLWASRVRTKDKPNPNRDPFNPRLTVEQSWGSGEQTFYPLPLPEAEIDYSEYKSPCPDSPWSLEIQQQISRISDSCTLLGTSDQINYYYSMRGPAGFSWQGGTFEIHIQLPPTFPTHSPRVRFLTPIFNTSVGPDGKIATLHAPEKTIKNILWIIEDRLGGTVPSKVHHFRKKRFEPGWNEDKYQLYVTDPKKFHLIAQDWTTCYAKGEWKPEIHRSLDESFRKDVKIWLLIVNRLESEFGILIPKEILVLIIHYLIPRRVLSPS